MKATWDMTHVIMLGTRRGMGRPGPRRCRQSPTVPSKQHQLLLHTNQLAVRASSDPHLTSVVEICCDFGIYALLSLLDIAHLIPFVFFYYYYLIILSISFD